MKLGGQPVPNGHTSVFGELFHDALGVAAVFDAVIHSAQHLRGVRNTLLFADLRTGRIKIGRMHAEVEGRDFKGTSGARAGFLKDQRDVLAVQRVVRDSGLLLRLEFRREREQARDFLRREVEQLEKTLAFQVHVLRLL
ncbi:hypothetical protein SDC9_186676 [bioreactor metagenome]|uniref:Uncharacterized protein n=1 Tax=bioreactor metagenome TaxID=1076179 RepID=A0A645HJF7_9ZZZZ